MENEVTSWDFFEVLPKFLIDNLNNNGFSAPFAVQTAVINAFFSSDRDLSIGFPTGSGKTLAYLIPIICQLHARIVPRLRATIVVPSRELARQVFDVASLLVNDSSLSISVLSAGLSTGKFDGYPDILITTPLALSTHIVEADERVLNHTEIIVIDENDVILELPLENWLEHVQRSLVSTELDEHIQVPFVTVPQSGRKIRRILCSATLSRTSKQSEDFGMDNPIVLVASDRSRYAVPVGVHEEFSIIERGEKVAALLSLCQRFRYTLCFVGSSKRAVALSKIMKKLRPNLNVIEFSATVASEQKRKALLNPEEKESRLIIATDALARGVDLPFIDAVVNFDIAGSSRTYIHRMGRTARGGNQGVCVSLLMESELIAFRDIVAKIDGSSPAQIEIDTREAKSYTYKDLTKPFEHLKIRRPVQKKKTKLEEDAEEDEYEEEEDNKE